jgi:hypothetical protein
MEDELIRSVPCPKLGTKLVHIIKISLKENVLGLVLSKCPRMEE